MRGSPRSAALIEKIQRELFSLGSELARGKDAATIPTRAVAQISAAHVKQMELTSVPASQQSTSQDPLEGIIQLSSEGRPHLTVPAGSVSAKEALALVLYATHPKPFGDDELSSLLGASWKTTSGAIIRARASELKREGKLIAERGSYVLSGAGVQWVKGDVIPNLRKTMT